MASSSKGKGRILPSNLASAGSTITREQASEGRRNTRVTVLAKDHPRNGRGIPVHRALRNPNDTKSAVQVALYHGIWYQINYHRELDTFYIIDAWLELHDTDIYEPLLDGPKKPQQLLDEGLTESAKPSPSSEKPPVTQETQEELPEEEVESDDDDARSEEQEQLDQQIRLTPIHTMRSTNDPMPD